MGSPENDHDRDADDEELHWVTLTHDFYICKTEVTRDQWKAVMSGKPSSCRHRFCGNDVAKIVVMWETAVEYLNKLSRLEGLDECYSKVSDEWEWNRECTGYRLPTEAE